MNYKKQLCCIAVLLTIMLCGCTQRQIINERDELMSFSWENHDDYSKQIKLCFQGNYASLFLHSCSSEQAIKGITFVDNNCIRINDTSHYTDFLFSYRLYGDKIDLSYQGNTITLFKAKQ